MQGSADRKRNLELLDRLFPDSEDFSCKRHAGPAIGQCDASDDVRPLPVTTQGNSTVPGRKPDVKEVTYHGQRVRFGETFGTLNFCISDQPQRTLMLQCHLQFHQGPL